MVFEVVAVLLLVAAGYLWVLNRRVGALPANASREEPWLKDEELELP
ncbi:MAG: hypothetical protein KAW41_02635 [Candidatus Diapherotrites archaeon]|nr:hypothetical protein [Candidatus Diapherotrites archaeon]